MYRLAMWLCLLMLIQGGCVAGVRAGIQSGSPVPDLLLNPADCPQPCWQGYRPGIFLSAAERTAILEQQDYYRVQPVYGEGGELLRLHLTMRGDILLADIILQMGIPEHVQLRQGAGTTPSSIQRQRLIEAYLFYANGRVQVRAVHENPYNTELSPAMIIRDVWYYKVPPSGWQQQVIPWRGFHPAVTR